MSATSFLLLAAEFGGAALMPAGLPRLVSTERWWLWSVLVLFAGITAAGFFLLVFTAALFGLHLANRARRLQSDSAERFEEQLAWMQRVSVLGHALSRILHELKTPLGTISLSAEYLRERLRQGPTPDLDEQLSVIETEAEHASDIVRNYLEFVRPTDIALRRLAVQKPLSQALAALKLRMEEQEVRLDAALAGPDEVLGSHRHLVQLFSILLDNALVAMPLGGRLDVAAGIGAGQAVIRIQDTGVGLTPEVKARLFEPFATSRPDDGGTGLGLAIARSIVLKHGGSIALESPGPAKGTTATVRLPLAGKI